MELQHFSEKHPLVFMQEPSHESDKLVHCSGCGDLVSGPRFRCAECGFYLDKHCAEAPFSLNHHLHRKCTLTLVKEEPCGGIIYCDFCRKRLDNFIYDCSCDFSLHIKCALITNVISEKGIAEFQHIARIDPLLSSENRPIKLKNAVCFVCWKPLLASPYFSPDCGFHLHVKCVDLPAEINHHLHQEHPLILQYHSHHIPCHICGKTRYSGLVYCCLSSSACDFALHIECAKIATKIDNLCLPKHSLTLQKLKDEDHVPCQVCHKTETDGLVYYCSICKFSVQIECVPSLPSLPVDKSHNHSFVMFGRHVSFICDACGCPGKYECYICSTCSIIVHKKCILLPSTFKHPIHPEHPISHTYFLRKYEIESWKCRICHIEDVNLERGGYYCSVCKYIVHARCAMTAYNRYEFDESDEEVEDNSELIPYSIIKETKDGENVVAIEIKHFSHHDHNLVLRNDNSDDKYCDGCVLPIFTSSYYGCSECDFFLHKSCAELPRKKRIWFHIHPKLHILTVDHRIFKCERCEYETSGFGYACSVGGCNFCFCLRCAIVSDMPICGHEHPLPYYHNYQGSCDGCGDFINCFFGCKDCDFALCLKCLKLPLIARHKSDEHPYKLTYNDNNDYSESHYCDICEEERDSKKWFYHCTTCDNSAHPKCALGKYPYIKLGSINTEGDHPHTLTFVQKVHYYPGCHKCGELCLELALECKTTGCTYIVHWECLEREIWFKRYFWLFEEGEESEKGEGTD